MKKVLVLGHNGMLGNAVCKYLEKTCEVETICYRWDDLMFKRSVILSEAEYVVNCIGAIPQKKYDGEKFEQLNIELPMFLETTNKKIIHPSTDCEFSGNLEYPKKYKKDDISDADDDYGKSKAKISDLIINKFKNTKIIRTSIIGHEISKKKYSLLDWFLSSNDFVYGFQNHYWNGITTLEWSKICENMINNWNDFGKITQVGIDGLSKYELLKIIKSVYSKEIEIGEKITEKTANKMLESDVTVNDIKTQLGDLKIFYEK